MPDDINLPTSDLSGWQLKLSYFYVSNKLLLRKLLLAFLILINVFLWSYVILNLGLFVVGYSNLQKDIRGLLFNGSPSLPLAESQKPVDLKISAVESFPGNEVGKYDLMAEVINENIFWLAEFDYEFKGSSGGSGRLYRGFVLPGSKKFLFDLNQTNGDGQLEIKNISWRRFNDYATLKNQRELFLISQENFYQSTVLGNPSKLDFVIKNNSPFGYWRSGVAVLLYGGGSLVGVNYLDFEQFQSGAERLISLNWSKPLPLVDNFEIIPEIDYLSDYNLMPPAQQ